MNSISAFIILQFTITKCSSIGTLDRKAKIIKNNFASLFILKSFVKVLKFKVNWVDMYFNKTQRY